jgi:hypothetical protein
LYEEKDENYLGIGYIPEILIECMIERMTDREFSAKIFQYIQYWFIEQRNVGNELQDQESISPIFMQRTDVFKVSFQELRVWAQHHTLRIDVNNAFP